jgi:hypothetical protein
MLVGLINKYIVYIDNIILSEIQAVDTVVYSIACPADRALSERLYAFIILHQIFMDLKLL